jgi:hypothetical protein
MDEGVKGCIVSKLKSFQTPTLPAKTVLSIERLCSKYKL